MNHKSVSFETFSSLFFSHGYRVIQISNFCTQTGSVRNGWKFPVAKWTELAPCALRPNRRISGLSFKPRTFFLKICSQFSENTMFEKFVKILFPQQFQLCECFSVWCTQQPG